MKYTDAYLTFAERLTEIKTLQKLAFDFERKKPSSVKESIENIEKANFICRGAIILLTSHVEMYIKEIGNLTLEKIVEEEICRSKISNRISYYISRNRISEIKEANEPDKITKKILKFIQEDFSLWEQTGPLPNQLSNEEFNAGFSSPEYESIKKYFRRFGYDKYDGELKRKLKKKYSTITSKIDTVVSLRHQIAHGDAHASQTPSDLIESIKTINEFCRVTDIVFAKWCKKYLCAIK